MASKLQFDEVLQQINDDSDWCDSDDDLVTDEQVGDLESFSFPKACDPLDRVDEEIEEEETSFVPSSEELSSGQTPTASTGDNSTNSSTLPSTSNCFLPTPGPKVDIDPESHPIDFFCTIWGNSTFQEIAEQTNLYAAQKGTISWEDISEDEMKYFVGIQLAMGIVRLPSLRDYWSTNPLLGTPGIVKGMGRNRFQSILSHLHLNDNSKMPQRGSPNFDKLYKVRPLFEVVKTNSQACYQPHQQMAVDEAMILFKGRSNMKQFMPLKPIKRGYKAWCACDSLNGFMYNIDMYTGRSDGSGEDGLGSRVVQQLMEPLYDQNYHVYMDNFFSSTNLAKQVIRVKKTRGAAAPALELLASYLVNQRMLCAYE